MAEVCSEFSSVTADLDDLADVRLQGITLR
jgi:hypothetical protein